MTLPLYGLITLNDINVELGRSAGASITLNDADVRALAEKPTGQVKLSDLYGKSSRPNPTVSTSVTLGIGDYFGFNNQYYGFAFGEGSVSPNKLGTQEISSINAMKTAANVYFFSVGTKLPPPDFTPYMWVYIDGVQYELEQIGNTSWRVSGSIAQTIYNKLAAANGGSKVLTIWYK